MAKLESQLAHLDVPLRSAAGDHSSGARIPSMSVSTRSRRKQSPLPTIAVAEHQHATRSHRVPPSPRNISSVAQHDAGASSKFRPLLPAAAGPPSGHGPFPLPPRKRSAVAIACCACQKARTKVGHPHNTASGCGKYHVDAVRIIV